MAEDDKHYMDLLRRKLNKVTKPGPGQSLKLANHPRPWEPKAVGVWQAKRVGALFRPYSMVKV